MNKEIQALAREVGEIKEAVLGTKTVYNPKEAAKYLGIALGTLYKLTSAGIVPFSKPNGKLIYFSRVSLDQWLLSNPSKSSAEREAKAATHVNIKKAR